MIGKTNVGGTENNSILSKDVTLPKNMLPQGYTSITNDSNDLIIGGSMPVHESQSATLNCGGSKIIPAGYTPGGVITANSLASQTPANGAAWTMLNGQTAWVNGAKMTGTMPNYIGVPTNINAVRLANGRFEVAVAAGYHGYDWAGNSYEYMSYDAVANAIGLTAEKIKSGVTILNRTGTFQGPVENPLYLAREGSGGWMMVVSNGFITQPSQAAVQSKSATVEAGSSSSFMGVLCKANNQGWFYSLHKLCNKAIYLGGYSKLRVTVSTINTRNSINNPVQRIGLTTNGAITGNNFNAYIDFALDLYNGVYELNISALNSSYWFYLYQQSDVMPSRGAFTSDVKIFEVVLL